MLFSILMSLLNLRLGYWAQNPRFAARRFSLRRPTFLKPGLGAVFGWGLNEDKSMIELSDGGHFENLGIYEFVRRRLDTIIVSDGGCDQKFEFADLSNAIERVRVDFGVRIEFDTPDLNLAGLIPKNALDRCIRRKDGSRRARLCGRENLLPGTHG
jgi:hypothetical protein